VRVGSFEEIIDVFSDDEFITNHQTNYGIMVHCRRESSGDLAAGHTLGALVWFVHEDRRRPNAHEACRGGCHGSGSRIARSGIRRTFGVANAKKSLNAGGRR
jgi:hypothetical protein